MKTKKNFLRWDIFSTVIGLIMMALTFCFCKVGTGDKGSYGYSPHYPKDTGQLWTLIFYTDSTQVVWVKVAPQYNYCSISENSISPGFWVWDKNGQKCFRCKVSGQIIPSNSEFRDDQWEISLSGDGCEITASGLGRAEANDKYPKATYVGAGTLTMNTTSTGTTSIDYQWYGFR